MKVGLFAPDSKLPNLALMKISTFHKGRGHRVFLNEPGDINYFSCVFTKTKPKVESYLSAYPDSVAGGPGWDPSIQLPPEIERCSPDYTLFGIEYGIGRLTQGCPGNCPYCVVPQAEGNVARTVNSIGELINLMGDLVILLDSNILACPDWPGHFQEIRERDMWVDFTQGLDIRYVSDLVANELKKLKITSLSAWLKARRSGRKLRKSKGLIHFA